MTVQGQVKDGLVVPDVGNALPEGARVVIQIITDTRSEPVADVAGEEPRERAIMKFAGVIDDLPADASENVDHYLYGHRRK
jgi:hypothetical protein